MLIKNESPMPINKKIVRSVANTTITGKNIKKKILIENKVPATIRILNSSSIDLFKVNSIKNIPQDNTTIYHKNYNANEYTLEGVVQQNSPNKTIYMTYKKNIPNFVFGRWKKINPDYTIEFNLDHDCISFLEKHFNNYIADLFKRISKGMYKADLWRLCKLYINGGIYADVDLVPYLNINSLDKSISFYSCLAQNNASIFQAFMVNFSKPKNPLILSFLISFLMNNPYTYNDGPTYDMYNCIKHNLNGQTVLSGRKYDVNEIKIPVTIGSSDTNIKTINLYYFPKDIDNTYTVKLNSNEHKDQFKFEIINSMLIVTRTDKSTGWGHNHYCTICIQSRESIFLFKENKSGNCYVTHNNNKILDSRDPTYSRSRGW